MFIASSQCSQPLYVCIVEHFTKKTTLWLLLVEVDKKNSWFLPFVSIFLSILIKNIVCYHFYFNIDLALAIKVLLHHSVTMFWCCVEELFIVAKFPTLENSWNCFDVNLIPLFVLEVCCLFHFQWKPYKIWISSMFPLLL